MKDKSTNLSITHQIPAGLLISDSRTEIFGCRETKQVYFLQNGKTEKFNKLSGTMKAQLFEQLLNDENAIEDLKNYSQEEAIEKFAFCIYGAADYEADFDENGILNKPDNFVCSNNCQCLKWKSKKITIDGNYLTPKEFKIITLFASDLADKQIAEQLGITESTLNTHKHHLFEKSKTHSKAGLISKAFQQKIIQ